MSGDKYFVCWDQGLIPLSVSSPYTGYITSTSSKIAQKLPEVANGHECVKNAAQSTPSARETF